MLIKENLTNRHFAPTVSQTCSDDVLPVSRPSGHAVMFCSTDRPEPQVLGLHMPTGVKQISFHHNLDAVLVTFYHKGLHCGIPDVGVWPFCPIQRGPFESS